MAFLSQRQAGTQPSFSNNQLPGNHSLSLSNLPSDKCGSGLARIGEEVKVDERHVHGLTEVGKKIGPCRKYVISNDKIRKSIAGAECLYWREWLERLASDL